MKVMMMIKLFVTAIAIAVALTIAISTTKNIDSSVVVVEGDTAAAAVVPPSRRVSRFLAEDKNARAADHCKNDDEICYVVEGKNSTCCNNKCMDLGYDRHNCGACKNKCKFTTTCCRGECVNRVPSINGVWNSQQMQVYHCDTCNSPCKHWSKGEGGNHVKLRDYPCVLRPVNGLINGGLN
ncbi:stigma-specific STIG1-like protein 1 [Ipomoea triloba]|uniref:stigma-specific STIG1-like protein 1 n=1 Tax=Ipomoea triloba TaxID=35885 RepID=UPI00125DF9DE|nr:stigma-specific STIG1-like protein 1 [Ipomoea triloba]